MLQALLFDEPGEGSGGHRKAHSQNHRRKIGRYPKQFDADQAPPGDPTPILVTARLDTFQAMFRYRQQLRQWAARVLLLWLFGIAAGVANACITTEQGTPIAAAVSHLAAVVDAHHDVLSHDHAGTGNASVPSQGTDAPSHLGNLSKANCQDFCDKATVSIPPLKSALDDVQSHAVIAMTAVTVLPMPAFAPVQLRVPRRDGVLAPSIPIAFLRLAL